jgi:hypothetical protein
MKINNKTTNRTKKFEGILIDKEAWEDRGEARPEYACSYCSRLLVRLSDRNNQNESWYCNSCSIEFPDKKETKKKSRLGTQRNEVEPAVTSVGTIPDVSIRHEPTLKGGFAALAKKGTIRFTSYQTTEKE